MQQTHSSLFEDGTWREALVVDSQSDARLARIPNGDTHLKIRHLCDGLGNGIHSEPEMRGAKSVVNIAEHVLAAMHGAAAMIGGVRAGAQPFEVIALAPVNFHIEIRGGDFRASAFGSALDGVRECVRSLLTKRVINFS